MLCEKQGHECLPTYSFVAKIEMIYVKTFVKSKKITQEVVGIF